LIDNKKVFAFAIIALMTFAMTSAFIFSQTTGTSTPVITPAIPVVLLTRQGNQLRIQWAQLVAANMQAIGISATSVTLAETQYDDRVVPSSPGPTVGASYANGGFDVAFIGWSFAPEPGPIIYALYDNSQYIPIDDNYYFWNNTQATALDRQMLTEANQTNLYNEVDQWERINYAQIPEVTIFYSDDIYPVNPYVNTTAIHLAEYPIWPAVETWGYNSSYPGDPTKLTLEQPQIGYTCLDPYHTPWYYDLSIIASYYGEEAGYGMLMRNESLVTQTVPYMASSYTVNSAPILWNKTYPGDNYVSAPGTYWNFTIRPGIRFSNGESLTGQDVVWTIRYAITPAWGNLGYGYDASIVTSNASVYWQGEAGTPGAELAEPVNDMNVIFNLTAPWATFRTDIGALSILPASVLTNSSSGIPTLATWVPNTAQMENYINTAFCTGVGSYVYYGKNESLLTGTGPVGAGPYEFGGYSPTTQIVTDVKNPYYFNAATLEAIGEYKIDDFYIYGQTSGAQTAISDLKAGTSQVLDTNYEWASLTGSLLPAWSKIVVNKGYGCQEMGFNMNSPIWGTGVDTPLGMANASQAAQAALDVRLAMEAMVPKQYIITQLMHGFATYGITSPITPNTFGFDTTIPLRNYTSQSAADAAAIGYLVAAGYSVTYPSPPTFWDAYGLVLAIVELAVIVVLAGFYFFRPRRV